jgi:hypothetical protein
VTQRYIKVDRAAVLAADAVSAKIAALLDGQATAAPSSGFPPRLGCFRPPVAKDISSASRRCSNAFTPLPKSPGRPDDAMDRVDPGVFRDVGTDKERQEFEAFISLDKFSIDERGTVLASASIHEEHARRARRRTAFGRVREQCAYGKVPSALLLDDFTVRVGRRRRLQVGAFKHGGCTVAYRLPAAPRPKLTQRPLEPWPHA